MSKWIIGGLLVSLGCFGILGARDFHLTLSKTLELSAQKSLNVRMAEAQSDEASAAVGLQRAPYYPMLSVGSGIAETYGFPLSIEGSAPTIFEVDLRESIYDRVQSKKLQSARLKHEGSQAAVQSEQEKAALEAGSLYLELRNQRQRHDHLQEEVKSLQKIVEITQVQVEQGAAEPRDLTEAQLAVAKAKADEASTAQAILLVEEQLRQAVGAPADAVLVLGNEPVPPVSTTEPEPQLVDAALQADPVLKQLRLQESADMEEVEAWQGRFYPTIALVGKYGLFSKINNYNLYFTRFQRNNALIGASIQLPLFSPERAPELHRAHAQLRQTRISIEHRANQIRLDMTKQLSNLTTQRAQMEVSRLEVKLAQEDLQVAQAQYDEGRIPLSQLEKMRSDENAKWLQYLSTKLEQEKTQLQLRKRLGHLLESNF